MLSRIFLIAQNGPRGLQICAGALHTLILDDFSLIFRPFLIDFWLTLDPFFNYFVYHFKIQKTSDSTSKTKNLWSALRISKSAVTQLLVDIYLLATLHVDCCESKIMLQKDGDSFYFIWGSLAVRRQGDLDVHRQQYFVYMIFDDQLVKILHHPKVMHNQD